LYLEEVRVLFSDDNKRINWSHAKYRYEIEIPIEMVGGDKKPENYEFTSAKKDFQRFHTLEIKTMIDELENAEEKLREAFTPFLSSLFSKFHEKKFIWDSLVNLIAELDCLVALSILSG
jgi:DNA mismatch repair protein MSH6